jgi:hypothetical protein
MSEIKKEIPKELIELAEKNGWDKMSHEELSNYSQGLALYYIMKFKPELGLQLEVTMVRELKEDLN